MPLDMSIFLFIWYVPLFVLGGLTTIQYYQVRRLCRSYYPRVQYQTLRLSVWLMQYDEPRARALMRIERLHAPDLDHAVARFYRCWRGTGLVMWVGMVIFVLLMLRHVVG